MAITNVTAARKNLYRLIDQVNEEKEPVFITGQRGNAVLLGEDDWRAIQETLYLEAIPGYVDSVLYSASQPLEQDAAELNW